MTRRIPFAPSVILLVSVTVAHLYGDALSSLKAWCSRPEDKRPPLEKTVFFTAPLSREEAVEAAGLIWQDKRARLEKERAAQWKAKKITIGNFTMRFDYRTFGEAPESGRSLYISMHGGGNAPAQLNDSQWRNQIRLYTTPEGSIYLAPRAPTNAWNLWHQAHIDAFFRRLIEDSMLFADVNPDKVYLMGYSAGGDGVYQVAPRMADRFAAAAMMAGHPNETSPLGLRNLPFSIWVGERDGGYNRNKIAEKWGKQLDKLHKSDPEGYIHQLHIVPGAGHWMNRKDAASIAWMAQFARTVFPKKVVWKQDDVTHGRFYWLALPEGSIKPRSEITATCTRQAIALKTSDGISSIQVRLHDQLLDLDRPVVITWNGATVFRGKAERTVRMISRCLSERNDPHAVFPAEIVVSQKKSYKAMHSESR